MKGVEILGPLSTFYFSHVNEGKIAYVVLVSKSR